MWPRYRVSRRHLSYTPSVGIVLTQTEPIHILDVAVRHFCAAACLLFVAFLQGTCSTVYYSQIHTIFMGMTMSLALLFIIIAFAVDVILFNLIGQRIRADGYSAHLGSATWMTLAALIIAYRAGALVLEIMTMIGSVTATVLVMAVAVEDIVAPINEDVATLIHEC
jgi:hypothetical protein